jgi:MFS family permease
VRRLLAHRDVRIYLTGQVFSLFGDSTLWLAMGIWVKTLTGSNAQAGLVFFFFTAPSLLAPGAGLLADRVRRRPLLIAANALTALAVLALLAVNGRGQVWVVDAVMFGYGLSYIVLGPAQSALLTVIVPADLLPDANGALRTAQESLRLIGPLVGAGLFVAVGAHVIAVIDAATLAFPVVSLLLLRVREPDPEPASGRWAAQLSAGARHIWRTVELRHVIAAAAITTTVFGFAETISYAIAGNGLHRPAAFVGILAAVQGAGAVAGGLTAAPLVRRLTGRRAHQPGPAGHPGGTARTRVRRRRVPHHHPADDLDRPRRRPDHGGRVPDPAARHGRCHRPGRRLPAHPARAAGTEHASSVAGAGSRDGAGGRGGRGAGVRGRGGVGGWGGGVGGRGGGVGGRGAGVGGRGAGGGGATGGCHGTAARRPAVGFPAVGPESAVGAEPRVRSGEGI